MPRASREPSGKLGAPRACSRAGRGEDGDGPAPSPAAPATGVPGPPRARWSWAAPLSQDRWGLAPPWRLAISLPRAWWVLVPLPRA